MAVADAHTILRHHFLNALHSPRSTTFGECNHGVIVNVTHNRYFVRSELDRAERHFLRRSEWKELCAEPAGAIVRVRINTFVDDCVVVTSRHQVRQETRVVASTEEKELFARDHGQTDRLEFTSIADATSMKLSPYCGVKYTAKFKQRCALRGLK